MKEKSNTPLILIFSPREQTRSILSAGLLQSNFQVMEANTSYIAGIKANQFLPDLIIADITKNNFKDFLFLSRLERSIRTKEIAVLISVTVDVRKALDKIHKEVGPAASEDEDNKVHLIEYPYNFNTLVKKISKILAKKLNEMADQSVEEAAMSEKVLGERLLDLQIPVQKKLQMVDKTVDKQWAFPFTVVKSLEIIGSDKSCCGELAKCISSDMAATSGILSMSNKVTFASRYGKITNVLDAVVRIGFNETRNILASLSLIDLTKESYVKYGFRRSEFWMHSLATAIIAEKLCRDIKFQRPEWAFIAGLIHDIGKIPIDRNFPEIFIKLLEETTNKITPFYVTEKNLMGFTHADLGHFFTTNWNFPTAITMTILNHHNQEKILATKITQDSILQKSVFMANIFAKALSMGHSCDEVLNEIPAKMLLDFQIPRGPSNTFLDKVFVTLKRYYEYLKLSAQEVALFEPQMNTKETEVLVVTGEKKQFHPIILGLKNNGFRTNVLKSPPEREGNKGTVTIFIPDKESPLDIVLTADDEEEGQVEASPLLKIFLLEGIEIKDTKKDLSKSNIVMMDSDSVDLRLILQIIEDYYYAITM